MPAKGRFVKRCFDVCFSCAMLVLLLPVLLTLALVVRGAMGPPVLFRQERPGLHCRPFRMIKFRTMRDAKDAAGVVLSDAERLTSVGRFLRRTSLDELPELWNVLVGEMSIVGPRPLLMEYLSLYSPRQARRHEVKPGITGWAQVNGRNALEWEARLAMDVWYVDNRSWLLDARILLLTVWRVMRATDVSQPGQATVERFRGGQS
jgi:sugar transferase EpsL